MRIEKFKAGDTIAKKQEKVMEWYLVQEGAVIQKFGDSQIELGKNSMIGILENEWFICDYIAKTDSIIIVIECNNSADLQKILAEHDNFRLVFLRAAIEQRHRTLCLYSELRNKCILLHDKTQEYYEEYKGICAELLMEEQSFTRMESFGAVELVHKAENWEIYSSNALMKNYYKEYLSLMIKDNSLCVGAIMESAAQMRRVTQGIFEMENYLKYNKDVLLATSKNDLFHLFFDLAIEASKQKRDITVIKNAMEKVFNLMVKLNVYNSDKLEDLKKFYTAYDYNGGGSGRININTEDTIAHILTYAGYDEGKINEVKAELKAYRKLPDMLSTEPDVMRLRKNITKNFYEIYEKAFLKSVEKEDKLSPIMLMFFNFGFMDVNIAGMENSNALYNLTDQLGLFNSDNVCTMYNWLVKIYKEEKEPSKNEFDQDYFQYLTEQRRTGEITEAEAAELKVDPVQKVIFEIRNLFQTANRMTYGKITTFCPVINGEDFINAVEKMAVTAEKIEASINKVREVDYSVLYREITFSDMEHGIKQEPVQKEVLPDVILTPVVGVRGAMWQETANARYDSKARFLFPMFTAVDIDEQMLENMGRYRWEICRKIQGVYWNDLRDKSLTSEYVDYIQFFKKNSALSADAKEKIKIALKKSRNNYREVFVKDYMNWMKFEAKGSFRLNKVARNVFITYCPFSKEIRKSLKANPLFESAFNKLELTNQKKAQRLEALYAKYEAAGGEIDTLLKDNLQFYQM